MCLSVAELLNATGQSMDMFIDSSNTYVSSLLALICNGTDTLYAKCKGNVQILTVYREVHLSTFKS